MPIYSPPVRDVRFVLTDVLGLHERLPSLDEDLVYSIVEEAARFSAEVIAPLNQPGDREGCTRQPGGSVSTPAGYRDAYSSCGPGQGLTFPAAVPVKRIDYLLISRTARCVSAVVLLSEASDHRPVLFELIRR